MPWYKVRKTGIRMLMHHTFETKRGISIAVAEELLKSTNLLTKKLMDNVVNELEANGSIRTGLLKKALSYKVETWKSNKRATKSGLRMDFGMWAAVGVNRAVEGIDEKGRTIWPVKYAHLVEFGHSKGSNPRGDGAPAKPFMRKGIAKTGGPMAIKKFLEESFSRGISKSGE